MDGANEDLFFLVQRPHQPRVVQCARTPRLLSRVGIGHVPQAEQPACKGTPPRRKACRAFVWLLAHWGKGSAWPWVPRRSKNLAGEDTGVYSLHGDGELQEGQIWEAAMYAAHHKIDNILSFVDCNGQQIDGSTDDVMSLGDLAGKWARLAGTCFRATATTSRTCKQVIQAGHGRRGTGHPTVVLMKTEMGKGVDFMEGTHKWHGIAPSDEQLELALGQLDSTLEDY